MPADIQTAVQFLETQWSTINENKIKGIRAETEFRLFLKKKEVHHTPGGWILTPSKNTEVAIPSLHKICLLPVTKDFSWSQSGKKTTITPALISAYNYFRQIGISAYIVEPQKPNEQKFELPFKKSHSAPVTYTRPYDLIFNKISSEGELTEVSIKDVFRNFPERKGTIGLRCSSTGRIDTSVYPWNEGNIVKGLFWFEYARYYCNIIYLSSNNDLDLFITGESGAAYPVEVKSKSAVHDNSSGDWFGIDTGSFAKMSFFTSNVSAFKTHALTI